MSNTVPEGWEAVPFGAAFKEIKNGCSFDQNSSEDGLPVTRIETISRGKINYAKTGWLYADGDVERFKIEKGDILFSHINSLKHIGKTAIKDDERTLYHGMNLLRFKVNKSKFSPIYLHNLLSWDAVREDMRRKAKQAINQASLNVQDIKASVYPIPPLPEQQKIAAILSSVDDVIEKTRAQIDKLKDLKNGMMQELLTKGVGSNGVPHTEFKDSPVGRIPVSWEVKILENAVRDIIDCEHKTAPYVDKSEHLVVRTTNVRDGELSYDEMKYTTEQGYKEWTKRATPSLGDVLFTREAPAGESCLVPRNVKLCMGQRMVLLRLDKDIVSPEFFSIFLTSESAKLAIYELSIGTTVSRINIEDIKNIPCIIPPLSEQVKISEIVQSIQQLISLKNLNLESLISNKKALMQELLTGRVRVVECQL